jgi:hypothetical protein
MVWHLQGDLMADQAQLFLVGDLRKSVLRTKYLYVELEPSRDFGRGIFEPILLALCWCDLLGALYTGIGTAGTSTARTTRYLREMLADVDARYADVALHLVKTYRHGVVHAYSPLGNFHLSVSDAANHLRRKAKPLSVGISVTNLLEDLAESIRRFASSLDPSGPADRPRTLAAFNKARRELQYAGSNAA